MVGPPLHHHGENRKYHWNFDDHVRNKIIASYIYGGKAFTQKYVKHSKGSISVLQKIYLDVISKCEPHRSMIKAKQKMTIHEWLTNWTGG